MSIESEIRALNRTVRTVLKALETTGKQEIEQNQVLVRLMDQRFRALEAFVIGTVNQSIGAAPEQAQQTLEGLDLASKVIRLAHNKANGDVDDTGNVL